MVDSKLLAMLKKLSKKQLAELLGDLRPAEAMAILDDWNLWAQPYQRIPPGKWRRWVLRAGRGSGKGYGAAKNINEIARDRKKIKTGEIGIIARTYADVRYTCVEGPSGILATARSDFKPLWQPGTGLLVWPNGVRARIFSADKPEGMRGPNWSVIWADEVCHWPEPKKTWWEAIEPALRIGWARAIITTTPLPDPFLRELESKEDTIVTRASTFDNRWLSKEVKDGFRDHYEGTRMGRQELYGEFVDDSAASLWNYDSIENNRVTYMPEMKSIVVAIDPAVTANARSDETGIIVVGICHNGHGYILHDATGIYTPHEWATKAVGLYHKYKADRIVAENNQGGDMVEGTIRAVDPKMPYTGVRATRGKTIRAEPVAALYERGMVHHIGVYKKLEDQLISWVPGKASPDRLDALVWGITHLMLGKTNQVGPLAAYL